MYIGRSFVLLRRVAFVTGVIALLVSGYVFYHSYTAIRTELASTTSEKITLADQLSASRAENIVISERLAEEMTKSGTLETKVNDIASTVNTLTKLSQTDKELLQKYSRVYFLNENYVPTDVSPIESSFTLQPNRTYKILTRVKPHLENMLIDAQNAGVPLVVLSSYRSFGEQASLKVSYKSMYGSGSNKFSADQGYSEHQLATAVDLTTKELGGTTLAFAKTPAYTWLVANAYRYGFVLSYPPGNTYYQYEPWHWRFIGIELATKLHNDGKYFYNLPQREIDTYLVTLFD